MIIAPACLLAWSTFARGDDTGVVTIERPDGAVVHILVEHARDAETRARGLMHRKALAPNRGMLFDFGAPRQITMWMKNTVISLDMIFIDSEGIVTGVAPRREPRSTRLTISTQPVPYVLEVNAGVAEQFGLEAGFRVRGIR